MNTRANRQLATAGSQDTGVIAAPEGAASGVMVTENTSVQPHVESEQELTLDEFCRRLSSHDRRVELISGFHASQVREGVVKSTESVFKKRYDDFGNKPV